MSSKRILVQPVISEKSFNAADKGIYMFRVGRDANKKEVASEVGKKFKVKVTKVNIINQRGKKVVDWRKRRTSYRQDFKKAVVTLKKGDTIDIFK
jgi:large subunit ribosomal protein L23